MKKTMVLILVIALGLFAFAGCSQNETVEPTETTSEATPATEEDNGESTATDTETAETPEVDIEKIDVTFGSPVGAPILSAIQLFAEEPEMTYGQVDYQKIGAPDLLASMIIKGELDMAIIPTNLAAALYNKGVDYKLVSSNVWGVMYVVSEEDITDWNDLIGREIYTTGRGLTPDLTFRYLLEANGIDPEKDVTLNYMTSSSELAAAFISGKSQISIMPEPMLSNVLAKRPEAKVIFDIQEGWGEATGTGNSYPQASLFVKNDLLDKHPEFVAEFLEAYEASIDWVNEHPAEAGQYYEALEFGLPAVVIEDAISRSNLAYVSAMDAKPSLEDYFKVLFESDPNAVGGQIPDEGFYYEGNE